MLRAESMNHSQVYFVSIVTSQTGCIQSLEYPPVDEPNGSAGIQFGYGTKQYKRSTVTQINVQQIIREIQTGWFLKLYPARLISEPKTRATYKRLFRHLFLALPNSHEFFLSLDNKVFSKRTENHFQSTTILNHSSGAWGRIKDEKK